MYRLAVGVAFWDSKPMGRFGVLYTAVVSPLILTFFRDFTSSLLCEMRKLASSKSRHQPSRQSDWESKHSHTMTHEGHCDCLYPPP